MQKASLSGKLRTLAKRLLTREVILYVVFGVFTTLVNYAVLYLFYDALRFNEHFANTIAWVVSVVFAYITNRTFVFESKQRGVRGIAREVALFFGARLLSFGIDELIVFVMITLLGIGSLPTKAVSAVFVVVFNYVASKLFIFKKQNGAND